ncbi:MAG TPA: long-chain fatty acid--CoA ligase [Candidatus Methanoperedens sp.]|nr:long-chain fatty acid--CoA ligase [Candidatus Methanoperedens sp.]
MSAGEECDGGNAGQTPATPWLGHYAPGVPAHVEHLPRLLDELLAATARRHPERAAVVFAVPAAGRVFTSAITFRALDTLVGRFAASLQRLGVAAGERLAICLPNCPQFVIAFLGAARAGVIAVPFNPLSSAREVAQLLHDSGAKTIVVLDRFLPLVRSACEGGALERVVVTSVKEHFPAPLWLLYTLTREMRERPPRPAAGELRFRDLLGPGSPSPVAICEDDTAVLLYTGGTTGVSKGVELTHRNLVCNAEQNRAWAGVGDGTDSALVALPLFHAFGLTCGLNLGVLAGVTQILFPNPRDTRGLAQAIHRLRPTIFPVVPTLLVGIASLPDLSRYDLRSIRICPCAGSALAPAVQRVFTERTGVTVFEGYGLTEASPVTHGNPPGGENRAGTIGLPYPDTIARVVGVTGAAGDLPFEGDWTLPGELVVRGPQVMKGYWKRPQDTAAQLRDGWLRTGDVAQMHRDGYFRIVDRLKDVIIRGGLNIYPAEVEAVIAEHPEVLEALVIGVPDPALGELVKAFVVPRPGAALTSERLLAFCRENLAKYKVPSAVEFRSELARSAVGKPLRRALREELAAQAGPAR